MAEPAEYAYDVFISYSHKDEAWVCGELLPRLEKAGLRVCIDYRDFAPGKPALLNMQDAAKASHYTLLAMTPAWVASEWTLYESLLSLTRDPAGLRQRTIPLRLEDCEPPDFIATLTYVDFARPDRLAVAWTMLLTALGAPPPPEMPEEPKPEEWCLKYPYPMPPNFTGRDDERTTLSEWLEADGGRPLLLLCALGGFGKSALCWYWLLHDVDPRRWPRAVWWSFYEGDASFDSFLQTTLEYLLAAMHLRVASQLPPGPRQQVDVLLHLLRQPGTLLILDGFERALRAYSGMDAAYRGDDPAGPMPTEHAARTTQPNERDCVNPLAEHFLRSVASLPGIRAKVLLTTRLRPRALEGHGGVLLAGCREEELTQMQPADAVAFFRAQGIRGGRAEIEAACAPYGYHPLSLRLLAGLVVADPRQPGDIAAARRLDVAGDLVQHQHHVLEQAYESLTAGRQRLLSQIACFRGPVGYEALAALAASPPEPLPHPPLLGGEGAASPFPPREGGQGVRSEPPLEAVEAGRLDADLRDLAARGLLHRDLKTNRYDLHPIVRRYAYDRLTGKGRSAAHRRLRDYFAAVPPPDKVQTLDDLAPVVELYHHTVRAGQYDEARTLFRDRINKAAYYQFGAYQLQIELLRALFPGSEDPATGAGQVALPRLKDESAQAWTLNELANSYSLSGQPRRAVPLFEGHNAIYEKRGDKKALATGLENLAYMAQIYIGALRAAEDNLRRAMDLSREGEDEFSEAVEHEELARLLAYRGAWREAEEELAEALALFEKRQNVQAQGVTWACRALRGLLLARTPPSPLASCPEGEGGRGELLAAARRALELADEHARTDYPVERDYVRAHQLLGAAHLVNGDLDEADRHLTEALTRCRGINMVEMEADILLELARLALALTPGPSPRGRGEEEATRLAQEALTIAERCGYVLQGADAHLLLARIALAAGDKRSAREHAQQARRLATCDGPPDYTYKVAYDEAGALLVEVG
jgi:tetratricopeptide (TPR) repeat protein